MSIAFLKKAVVGAAILGASFSAMALSLDSNVALGKTVTALPFSVPLQNPLSLLTDGVVPANGTYWADASTVSWQGGFGGVEIDLGGSFSVSSITVSHDNNDLYFLTYPNTTGGVGFVPFGPAINAGGMNTSSVTFASPITVSKLSFFGAGGDGLYSLGEVTVMGVAVPVPEPEGYAMFLAGLGLIGALARRRQN